MDRRGTPTVRQRVLDIAAAALAALLVFTAVPAVLVLVVGNPLSGGLGHTWHPLPRDALCVLAAAAWVAWVACSRSWCVPCRRMSAMAMWRAPRGGTVMDRLASRIAVGVLALTTFGAPLALSSSAGARTPPTIQVQRTGRPGHLHAVVRAARPCHDAFRATR